MLLENAVTEPGESCFVGQWVVIWQSGKSACTVRKRRVQRPSTSRRNLQNTFAKTLRILRSSSIMMSCSPEASWPVFANSRKSWAVLCLSRVEDEEAWFKHLMARVEVFLASDADFCQSSCKRMGSWQRCCHLSPSPRVQIHETFDGLFWQSLKYS